MAKGRRLSGIWLPIQLDTSAVVRDMEALQQRIASFADRSQKAFDGALNPKNLVKGVVDATKAMGTLRDSANALATIRMGGFERALTDSSAELRNLARAFGGTTAQQREMFRQMAQAQVVTQEVQALQTLSRTLRMTREETLAFVRARGMQISQSAKSEFLPTKQLQDLSEALSRAATQYRVLAQAAGESPSQTGFKKFLDTTRIREAIRAFEQLHPGQKLTARNYQQIANAAGVATAAVAQYVREQQKASGRGLAGLLSPTNLTAGVQSAAASLGVVGGMYGAVELGKAMYQAALRAENLQLAFESIYNSSAKASAQLKFVKDMSDELGISFIATADGAKKLFAASRGTELEKDANQIFKAFSTMGAALKLSGSEMSSVFLAVSQMISKGKVSAEELRLQLSERMPGAVTLFAKSLGVTTQELDKMLQKGEVGLSSLKKFSVEVEKTYLAGARAASYGLQAEMNRVSNAWFDLKRAFVDTEGSAKIVGEFAEVLRSVAEAAPQIASVTAVILKMVATTAGVYALIKAFLGLQAACVAVRTAFAAFASGGVLAALAGVATAPLALAAGVATLVTAVVGLATRQTEAEKVFSKYNKDMFALGNWAKDAAKDYAALNAEVAKSEEFFANRALTKAQEEWDALTSASGSRLRNIMPEVEAPGSGATEFEERLENLKEAAFLRSSERNKILTEAQKLGVEFIQKFNAGRASGMSNDDMTKLLNEYREKFIVIQGELAKVSGGGKELADAFGAAAGPVIETASNLDKATVATQKFGVAAARMTDSELKSFKEAYEAVVKGTKNADKELAQMSAVKGFARNLVNMTQAAAPALETVAGLENAATSMSKQMKADSKLVEDYYHAVERVGATAAEQKFGLSIIANALEAAGKAAGFSEEQIKSLQDRLRDGFELGGLRMAGTILSNLEVRQKMAGATNVQKEQFRQLSALVDREKHAALAGAIIQNSADGINKALEGSAVSAESVKKIMTEARKAIDMEEAAKNTARASSRVDEYANKIREVKAEVDQLQAKLNESKAESFSAKFNADLKKAKDWLRDTTGGTKAQREELKGLIADWERLGTQQAAVIEAEQRAEKHRDLTEANTRIVSQYKGLTGEGTTESYEAARDQYTRDLDFYKQMNAEKYITDEEYANKKMMLDAILADQQLRSQSDVFSRLKVAIKDYAIEYGDFTKHLGGVLTSAMDSTARAISAFAVSGARDFASLASAFESMAQRMLAAVADLLAQQAVAGLFSNIAGFFGGFGGATAGTTTSTNAAATSGNMGSFATGINFFPWAKGGAFSGGGNLSSYSNSVVSTPTLFSHGSSISKFALGAGLMGEAGPEAIMPLVRTSSGHLGVRSEGGGLQQSIVINVVDNAGVEKNVTELRDDQGNMSIEIMLEKAVGDALQRPGSSPYRALQNTWGGAPALANR